MTASFDVRRSHEGFSHPRLAAGRVVVGRCGVRWPGDAVRCILPPSRSAVNAGNVNDPDEVANQSAPLLVSSAGRVVWSERPFLFEFGGGRLSIEGEADVQTLEAAQATLRAAFCEASACFLFPAVGTGTGSRTVHGPSVQHLNRVTLRTHPAERARLRAWPPRCRTASRCHHHR